MEEAEQIMKRCQAGTRNYEEANNLHAACYRVIGKLLAQRTWVGLTDEDRAEILNRKWWDFEDTFDVDGFLRLTEAKLKEKNT